MTEFVVFIANCFKSIWNVLHIPLADFNGMSIYLNDILIVLVIFGFIITVYWKGARA